MKTKLCILLILMGNILVLSAQENDGLIISEYSEYNQLAGESEYYNHYVELCNISSEQVDLSKYQLWKAKNGGGWNGNFIEPLKLEGLLSTGDTYLITRPNTNTNPISIETESDISWSFLNITGDDAIGLAKDDGTGTFILVDVIGNPDYDHGDAWSVAGIDEATMDHTLIRKPNICEPTNNWEASAGTNTHNSQWIVMPQNNISDIGKHHNTCLDDADTINTVSALFIGNSYTYYNDMPDIVQNLAISVGDYLIQDSHTIGGYSLEEHLENEITINKIKEGYWDYMVLQEYSTRPIYSIETVEKQTFEKAHGLDSIRKISSPNGQVMFYMTWGRKNGHSDLCETIPEACSFEDMNNLLGERYRIMQENENGLISPVGSVWKYIRDHSPEIELYMDDESHPSEVGSYLIACTFYTTIFRKDPTALSYDFTLGLEEAQLIRNAVKAVVFDSLAYWNTYQPLSSKEISIDFNHIKENEIFLNNSDINLSVTANNPQATIEQVVYMINGELLKTDSVAPFDTTLIINELGTSTIVAIATDSNGDQNYAKRTVFIEKAPDLFSAASFNNWIPEIAMNLNGEFCESDEIHLPAGDYELKLRN